MIFRLAELKELMEDDVKFSDFYFSLPVVCIGHTSNIMVKIL